MAKFGKLGWVWLILPSVLILVAGNRSYPHGTYDDLHKDTEEVSKPSVPDELPEFGSIGARQDRTMSGSDLAPPGNPYIIESGSGRTSSSKLSPPENLQIIDPSKETVHKTVGKGNSFAGS